MAGLHVSVRGDRWRGCMSQLEVIDGRAAGRLLVSVTRQGPHSTSIQLDFTAQPARPRSTVSPTPQHSRSSPPRRYARYNTRAIRQYDPFLSNSNIIIFNLIVAVGSLFIEGNIILFGANCNPRRISNFISYVLFRRTKFTI